MTAGNGTAPFSTSSHTVSITVGVSGDDRERRDGGRDVVEGQRHPDSVGHGRPSSAGTATVALTIPGGLTTGTYTLTEAYTDSSQQFSSNRASGTLTISPSSSLSPSPSPSHSPSPSSPPTEFQAALTIALDVAAYFDLGNSSALGQLSQLSEEFLQKPLTPASHLIAEVFADLPYAGGLAASAVQLGITLGEFAAFSSPTGSFGGSGGGGGTKALIG